MEKKIYFAKNIDELLYHLTNVKDLTIVGGCTYISEVPASCISTRNIKELSEINRHERYIDVGPATTLSSIIDIGQNHLPQILYEALNCIANPLIRNMATIGGNICAEGHKLTLFAPLMALDARLTFKNHNETLTENIRNFRGIPEGFVLTNIRIPIVDSDISIFRRIGPEHSITQQSASFAFMASTEKNSLVNVRLAFAGPFTFQSKDLENALIGRHLPLTQKDISQITEVVVEEFQKAATDQMISDVVKQQFFNLARYCFEQLT